MGDLRVEVFYLNSPEHNLAEFDFTVILSSASSDGEMSEFGQDLCPPDPSMLVFHRSD